MSKKFNIKPPNWPKEYTFAEFAKLNSHIINENQLITLYNQYLNKYLTELGEKKIHFKQSKINQLLTELKDLKFDNIMSIATPGGGKQTKKYSLQFGGADKENYVSTTFDPDTYSLNQGYTVSYWVKPNTITSGAQVVLGTRQASNTRRFLFGLRNSTKHQFGGGTNLTNSYAHGMSVGNWYHWVITFSGHSDGYQWVRAYRNGEAVVVAGDGSEGGAYVHHNRGWTGGNVPPVYFGARNHGTDPTDYFFACNITDIAIFDESKDTAPAAYSAVDSGVAGPVPSFVTNTYNGGIPTNLKGQSGLVGYWRFNEGRGSTAKDSSGNGNHGTLTYTGDEGTEEPTWSTDVPK